MTWLGSKICALTGVVVLLSGCGGGGGGGGGGSGGTRAEDPRIGRLDAYEAQKLRVLGNPAIGATGLAIMPNADVPTEGTATFLGAATIRVEVPDDPVVLYGDAGFTVDFQSGVTNATLVNFFGVSARQPVANYGGEILVTGAQVRQNMVLDYAGTLTRGDSSLTFGGQMTAVFLDVPVAAILTSDLDGIADVDGTLHDMTLIVVGEGAVVPPPAPDPPS